MEEKCRARYEGRGCVCVWLEVCVCIPSIPFMPHSLAPQCVHQTKVVWTPLFWAFGEIPLGGHDWLKHGFRWLNTIFDSASLPRDQGWGWITWFDLYGDLKLPRDFSTSHLSIQKTLSALQRFWEIFGVVCQELGAKTRYISPTRY